MVRGGSLIELAGRGIWVDENGYLRMKNPTGFDGTAPITQCPQAVHLNKGWKQVLYSNQHAVGIAELTHALLTERWFSLFNCDSLPADDATDSSFDSNALISMCSVTGCIYVSGSLIADGDIQFGGQSSILTYTTTTTDGVQKSIGLVPIEEDEATIVRTTFIGRRTNAADRCGFIQQALIYREGAAGAVREGPINTPFVRKSANYTSDINVNGNNAELLVQGVAGHDVDWAAVVTATLSI